MLRRVAILPALALLAACEPPPPPAPPPPPKPSERTVFGGDRPTTLRVNRALYDASEPTPLVVLLHGLTVTAEMQLIYFNFQKLVDDAGVLLLAPDGTRMSDGTPFWNATDVCCDWEETGVDDSAYVAGVVREVMAEYNVDESRIFVVGHSNGGFMAYRLACDHADLFAGIVSVAGATYDDETLCAPSEPLSVLQIHARDDDTVFFEGETISGYRYPGAEESVSTWATYAGCRGLEEDGSLDLIACPYERPACADEDPETTVRRASGCPAGVGVELWDSAYGGHIPVFNEDWKFHVLDWLMAHPKPR